MNEFMEIMKNRRSIRKFEDKEVEDEKLKQILEAVQWSQSWANTQCWEVVVIRDQDVKDQLQETMVKGNPATNAIVQAPILLALCAKLQSSGYYKEQVTTKFGDWFMFDMGLATQNICLTAHSLGLGSVVVGLFDHDKAKQVLQVPEGYELVTIIPLGYPAKTPKTPERRSIEDFTHYERF